MTGAGLGSGPVAAWRLAARLRTLPLAAAPVLVGAACAWRDEAFAAGLTAAALCGALLLQIGANFANDAFDHERGSDGPERLGPARAAQLGLLSPRTLKRGTAAAFAGASLAGLYLTAAAGWPVAVIGALGMIAAVTYVGPGAYGYRGGGELAVFVLFGFAAVAGTYWVQARAVSWVALAAAWPLACLASAVLVVNNVRDLEADLRSGKRTLAVRLGPGGARTEYAAFVAAAYLALPILALQTGSAWVLLPLWTMPEAMALVARVRGSVGASLNPILVRTVRLELGFALSLCVGLLA